ncbi:OLC1v1014621C1 [Oldenlandia corymbosa var. corymbosa]|uniref:OLC1v1014621C1 n=1 Tax=Oldenlandia corymbosa var. corymbosa TaxID=529605 RepID=A0AAV1E148_OLDCO|nr:OLC1v1014621C1 [Oldenlandia corymbosa var. corymbosa]
MIITQPFFFNISPENVQIPQLYYQPQNHGFCTQPSSFQDWGFHVEPKQAPLVLDGIAAVVGEHILFGKSGGPGSDNIPEAACNGGGDGAEKSNNKKYNSSRGRKKNKQKGDDHFGSKKKCDVVTSLSLLFSPSTNNGAYHVKRNEEAYKGVSNLELDLKLGDAYFGDKSSWPCFV